MILTVIRRLRNGILGSGRIVHRDRVVVIGAGVGGLVSAALLAARGFDVTVVEKADAPGGKMREVAIGETRQDAGPTVFTMRPILEDIFAKAGTLLSAHLTLRPCETLARHAWNADERLDLFADIDRSADAIGSFAGAAEADGYRRFCADAGRIFRTLDAPFMQAASPGFGTMISIAGVGGMLDLLRTRPFTTLWSALGGYFRDPRLRQLFGRYSTYCGSDPFRATATLMLVAHVEQEGVWLVEGGMHRVARALETVATGHGARFRYGVAADAVMVEGGRVAGVRLADGDVLPAGQVVVNADVGALAVGRLGPAVTRAVPPVPPKARSLSALTWSLLAETDGFPLLRHTVFFSDDYAAEFRDIFDHGRLPANPTVYICAHDRGDREPAGPIGAECLLCLVNAPATGDGHTFPAEEIERCANRTFALLDRCGLRVRRAPDRTVVTTPTDFDRMFPATGGALYGRASHGWRASFQRPPGRTRIPGLYLAGGSAHPGPGVPMAALSGRLAVECLLADLGDRSLDSTVPSRATAMPGGMSTP